MLEYVPAQRGSRLPGRRLVHSGVCQIHSVVAGLCVTMYCLLFSEVTIGIIIYAYALFVVVVSLFSFFSFCRSRSRLVFSLCFFLSFPPISFFSFKAFPTSLPYIQFLVVHYI